MQSVGNARLIEALNWRYAVKKFDSSKKLSPQDWATLEQTLVLSASSFGLQPWKFLVIESQELRKQLTAATWKQTQVEDASHYVVFTAKTSMEPEYVDKFMGTAALARSVPRESLAGYANAINGFVSQIPKELVIHWNTRQAYLALGTLMTSAALLGLDTCPMEGLDPRAYDRILGIGTDYATVCACAIGYRSEEDKYGKTPKVRFPKTDVVEYR